MQKIWNLICSSDYFSDDLKSMKIGEGIEMAAGYLIKLMIIRTQQFIFDKMEPRKIDHWCWNFARDNLSTVCCMIFVKHYVEDASLVQTIGATSTCSCVFMSTSIHFFKTKYFK